MIFYAENFINLSKKKIQVYYFSRVTGTTQSIQGAVPELPETGWLIHKQTCICHDYGSWEVQD